MRKTTATPDDPNTDYFNHVCFLDMLYHYNITYLTSCHVMLQSMPERPPYSGVVGHRLDLCTFINGEYEDEVIRGIEFDLEDDVVDYMRPGGFIFENREAVMLSPYWGVKMRLTWPAEPKYVDEANIRFYAINMDLRLYTYHNYCMFKGISFVDGTFILPTFNPEVY